MRGVAQDIASTSGGSVTLINRCWSVSSTLITLPCFQLASNRRSKDCFLLAPIAANSFGPLMRFAFGADFAVGHLSADFEPFALDCNKQRTASGHFVLATYAASCSVVAEGSEVLQDWVMLFVLWRAELSDGPIVAALRCGGGRSASGVLSSIRGVASNLQLRQGILAGPVS